MLKASPMDTQYYLNIRKYPGGQYDPTIKHTANLANATFCVT